MGRRKKTKDEAKKRKAKFQQKLNTQFNRYDNMRKLQEQMEQQRIETIKRASLIEKIYEAKKDEFAHVVEGQLVINDETIYQNDDKVMCWKKDDNPVLAGIEELHNFDKYTIDFCNHVLNFMYQKQIARETTMVEDFELEIDEEVTIQDAEIVEE